LTHSSSEIIIYQGPEGISLDVRLEGETVWLDAHQIARLFGNIYKTNELDPIATCVKNAQVAADGKLRSMDFYNLDMILSVGYRVNSKRGTQFRIWATRILEDHLLSGSSRKTLSSIVLTAQKGLPITP